MPRMVIAATGCGGYVRRLSKGAMLSRITRVFLALTLALVGLPLLTAAGGPPAQSEHDRIVEFWTVERVSQAVPRDFAYNPATRAFQQVHHRPDHAGGPGGGGDKVTGASWGGGGAVVDTTGKVLFELGGVFYVCSASVVADERSGASLVLTAAHCLYENSGSSQGFASNWMFIPNYDAAPASLTPGDATFCEGTKYGCWTADALVVHSGFANAGGFNATAIQHDFAFAVLGPGGKNGTLVELLGKQAIMFSDVSRNTHVHAFGYPHASPYDGSDLVYCAGGATFDNRLANLTYKLECDMTGGSSGGPWGLDFGDGSGILMSVNSYRYLGGNSMYGPKFNSNTEALYTAAHTATDNATVP
jgi:V8-like Glu-specific endopeptidase